MTLRLMAVLGLVLVGGVGGGCQHAAFRQMNEFGTRVVENITGRTPTQDLRRALDQDFPDERRVGVTRLVGRSYGKQMPYTDQYKNMARFDKSPLVRATAIRALNRSRDTTAGEVFVAALSDTDAGVRLEAAKALVNVPDERAVPKLVELVRSPREDLDVRIAATDALRHYRTVDVGRALAGVLLDRQFSLAWQARRSLRNLTGTDFRYDEGAWLEYIVSPSFRPA